MNTADRRRLLETAVQYEEQGNDLLAKARGIRVTLDILSATATVQAQTQLSQKLATAINLHRAKPNPRRHGTIIDAVRDVLTRGPLSTVDLQTQLKARYHMTVPIKRFLDMASKGKLVTTGKYETRIYALPGTSLTAKTQKANTADNGHGTLYPFVLPPLPRSASTRDKKAAVSYAIWQLVKAAQHPVQITDIVASAKAAGITIKAQAVGALARYQILRRAPGSHRHSRAKTVVLGSRAPELHRKEELKAAAD